MGRSKMEEEFKEKLNQREIAPTPHAWDRLDAMLNEAEDKKVVRVRNLNWLYIAAGFIGIILIATMFFKNGETNQNNEVVVEDVKNDENNSGEKPSDSIIVTTPQVEILRQQTQVAEVKNTNQKAVDQRPTTKKDAQKTLPAIEKMQTQTQVAQVENKQPATDMQQPVTNQINKLVNSTAGEQLASVESQPKKVNTIKVDANSLLSQVDGELELSFREKVIKLANKKYQNVKVALANRNVEN